MSWSDDPLVKAAVALAPQTVLRVLADVAGAADGPPPFLTVHLAGGHALEGGLVTFGADRESDVVVLADAQTGRLGYALLSGVVAVELHNPGPFRDLLTGGQVPFSSDTQVANRHMMEVSDGPGGTPRR